MNVYSIQFPLIEHDTYDLAYSVIVHLKYVEIRVCPLSASPTETMYVTSLSFSARA
jgi:hypothetical protein